MTSGSAHLGFLPDGGDLLFSATYDSQKTGLYRISLENPVEAQRISPESSGDSVHNDVGYFSFSPNGDKVIYLAKMSDDDRFRELYVTYLREPGRAVKLNKPIGEYGKVEYFRVSADGRYVAYAATQDHTNKQYLYLVELANRNEVRELVTSSVMGRGLVGREPIEFLPPGPDYVH